MTQTRCRPSAKEQGFTLVEVMVVVAIIGIAVAVGWASSVSWGPNHKLNSAAKDLNSTLQSARMIAVKRNTQVYVVFDNTASPGSYFSTTSDPAILSEVASTKLNETSLGSYGHNIDYSVPGGAFVNWNDAAVTNAVAASFPSSIDGLPYCTFNSDGTLNGVNGSIYLAHKGEEHLVYAVTLLTTGFSKTRKYNGILPFNKKNWIE